MIRFARRFFSCLAFLSLFMHFTLDNPVPGKISNEMVAFRSKFFDGKNCLGSRKWVAGQLEKSMSNLVPTCTLLNHYNVTEATCVEQETEANWKFSDAAVLARISNCSTYFNKIKTVAFKQLTYYEETTHLAFVTVTHTHLGLLEAHLATIFRPQNAYCIFVDKKAMPAFKAGVQSLVECYKTHFPSSVIFIIDNAFPVFWADISLIKADLYCMRDLLVRHKSWKYVINQAGTSLPQIPVWTMAEWLHDFGDLDAVISGVFPNKLTRRITYVHERPKAWDELEKEDNNATLEELIKAEAAMHEDQSKLFMYPDRPIETRKLKGPPPFGLRIFKGEREMVLSRKTVSFSIESTLGQSLWTWIRNVAFPEEIYFNTIVRVNQSNPVTQYFNGTTVANQVTKIGRRYDFTHGLCSRRTMWYYNKKHCYGIMKRHLCNLAFEDLPEAYDKLCLFINKVDLGVDGRIVACLHEYLTSY